MFDVLAPVNENEFGNDSRVLKLEMNEVGGLPQKVIHHPILLFVSFISNDIAFSRCNDWHKINVNSEIGVRNDVDLTISDM